MKAQARPNSLWWPALPGWTTTEHLAFAVRNWLASMLALYIAFALQLESPVWSWLTVWIVAQPTPGMVLSKGLYRVIGTIAGASIAVVLISLFAQTPELFVLALALLVGGCTVASNLLTNFRAYATVLAAYTAGIVASDAISAPNNVLLIALARGSAILVGIACAVVVNSIFAPHRAEGVTIRALAEMLKAAAHRAVLPWQAPLDDRLKIGRKLIDDTVVLNTTIEYAAAESSLFRRHANNARSLLAHLLGIISARRSLDAHLQRCGWPRHQALQVYHGVVIDLLHDLPDQIDAGRLDEPLQAITEIRQELGRLRPEDETNARADVISARLVIDRIDDMLEHLGHALDDWRDILENRSHRLPRRTLNFHRDHRAAWINGLRAFVAVGLTGAFWIGSAWPHGPGALVFVSIILSLFSSAARPDRVGWAFFIASIPAVLCGLLCKYLVLPAASGFEYLVVATGLFLIPLGVVMANPRTMAGAVAFSLVFLNLAGPANPMNYDLVDSLNSAIAIEFGILFGTLAYVLIFPPDPHAARTYVTGRIRRGLGQLAARTPIVAFSNWETRMYDRVNRLRDPLNPSATPTDEWFEAGLGALTLGNEILRLRHWLLEEPMPAPLRSALELVLAGLARIESAPEWAYARLQEGRERVQQLDLNPGEASRVVWARAAGALEEIESYLDQHPRLLKRAPIP